MRIESITVLLCFYIKKTFVLLVLMAEALLFNQAGFDLSEGPICPIEFAVCSKSLFNPMQEHVVGGGFRWIVHSRTGRGLSDGRLQDGLREELEGKTSECKHGSWEGSTTFCADTICLVRLCWGIWNITGWIFEQDLMFIDYYFNSGVDIPSNKTWI